jgi:predicted permease
VSAAGRRRSLRERYRRFIGADPRVDVDDELAFHIDMRTEELVARGVARPEARERALRRFGDVEGTRAACLESAGRRERRLARTAYRTEVAHDLRFALRALGRQRGFAASAILALGLGIGVATAVFGVVDVVALRPLPYREPGALVRVFEVAEARPDERFNASAGTFEDWAARLRTFRGLAAHTGANAVLTGHGPADQLPAAAASASLAAVMGARPLLGRWFLAEDEQPGVAPVVVLSQGLWERLGARPDLVGETLTLDDVSHTVVGVMPGTFHYPGGPALWRPLGDILEGTRAIRGARFLSVVGRLAPGVTLERAQADLSRVANQLAADVPEMAGHGAVAVPLTEVLLGPTRPRMLALLGAVGLLLLLACANVAGLLLARATTREQEMAVRAALGASRARLVRQLATEGLALWVMGGLLGIVLSRILVPFLVRASPVGLPRLEDAAVDLRVLAFAAGATLLAGLVFGLVPALGGARAGLALRAGTGRLTAGRRQAHARRLLVVGQLGVSLILLVGAGLMLRSLGTLLSVDTGFDPEHVTAVTIAAPGHRYGTEVARAQLWAELQEALNTVPRVRVVGGSNNPPVAGTNMTSPVFVEGRQPIDSSDEHAQVAAVLPGYFEALGIRIVEGRPLDAGDVAGATSVAVVSEALARRYFGDAPALGQRVRSAFGRPEWREVVGVAADVRHRGPGEAVPAQLYMPAPQHSVSGMTFLLRGDAPASTLAPGVRARVAAVDADLPVARIAPMEDLLGGTVALPRFLALALAVFSGLAALLALLGVYSVMAFGVTRRRPEIGTRLALGATRADILRLILGSGLRLAAAGIVVGLAGAWAVTRVLVGMLHGVTPLDPLALAGAAAVLVAGVLTASWLPAWRASRLDPVAILRTE